MKLEIQTKVAAVIAVIFLLLNTVVLNNYDLKTILVQIITSLVVLWNIECVIVGKCHTWAWVLVGILIINLLMQITLFAKIKNIRDQLLKLQQNKSTKENNNST